MPFCAFPSGLRCTAIHCQFVHPSGSANRRGGSQDELRVRTRAQYGEVQDRTESRHFRQAGTSLASVGRGTCSKCSLGRQTCRHMPRHRLSPRCRRTCSSARTRPGRNTRYGAIRKESGAAGPSPLARERRNRVRPRPGMTTRRSRGRARTSFSLEPEAATPSRTSSPESLPLLARSSMLARTSFTHCTHYLLCHRGGSAPGSVDVPCLGS